MPGAASNERREPRRHQVGKAQHARRLKSVHHLTDRDRADRSARLEHRGNQGGLDQRQAGRLDQGR